MDVRIVTEETLRHNQGPDLFVRKFSDTPANGYSFRLRKTMLLSDLRKHIEATLQIPQLAQRFWSFAPRQNQSFRPDEPLVGHEDMVRVHPSHLDAQRRRATGTHRAAGEGRPFLFWPGDAQTDAGEHPPAAQGQVGALPVPGAAAAPAGGPRDAAAGKVL